MKILKFGLPTCRPCTVLTEQMKTIDLASFEVEEVKLRENKASKELGDKYNIKSVPTLVILNDMGDEIERVRNSAQLELFLRREFLYKPKYVAGFDDYTEKEQMDKLFHKIKQNVLKLLYSFRAKTNKQG